VLPTAHIEFTWAAADFARKHLRLQRDLDYRGLALAAVLPDLIDKPLAIFVFPESHAALLYAHTLLFHLTAWLAVLKSPWRKKLLPYMLAFSGHLVADRIWLFGQTFLYPFKGWHFLRWRHVGNVKDFGRAYADILREEPVLVYFEIIGAVLLAIFVKGNRLDEDGRWWRFLKSGRV